MRKIQTAKSYFRLSSTIFLMGLAALPGCTQVLVENPGFASLKEAYRLEDEGKHQEAFNAYEKVRQEARSPKFQAIATTELAEYYSNGLVVQPDSAKRFALLQEAAALHHNPAVLALANSYRYGIGTQKDPVKAYRLYESIAQLNSKARLSMTEMEHRGEIKASDRTPADRDIATIESTVTAQDDSAMLSLGRIYRDGEQAPRDPAKAEQWYRKAIAAGNSQAAVELAEMWLKDRSRRNYASDALQLLTQVAEQGDAYACYRIGKHYENGDFGQVDKSRALEWYKTSVDLRSPEAMVALGRLLREAYPKDGKAPGLSAKLFNRAAELGSKSGFGALGNAYADGNGVPRNGAKALEYYNKASEMGLISADVGIGDMYRDGLALPRDYNKAFQYYQKAASNGSKSGMQRLARMGVSNTLPASEKGKTQQYVSRAASMGDPRSMAYMADLYATGNSVLRDDRLAAEWYTKSAEAGLVRAMVELYVRYETGLGVPQNTGIANQWFSRAMQANPKKVVSAAKAYERGDGVMRDYSKFKIILTKAAQAGDQEAALYLQKRENPGSGGGGKGGGGGGKSFEGQLQAAGKGDAQAMFNVSRAYTVGKSVPQDDTKAAEWMSKAAKAGNAEAMVRMGEAHRLGRGVEMDNSRAFEWYKKAADAGDPEGQYETGVSYARGRGVTANTQEAMKWLKLAEKNGYPGATAILSTLSTKK